MRRLVGGISLLFLLGGLRFVALGAWPVLPFMGIDVALLYWAFRSNYAAGAGQEHLQLQGDALTLRRISPTGGERVFDFNAYWTRVHIEETALGDAHLWLAARGRRVRVGGFLSAPERRAVGAIIAAALTDYRAGRPSTSSIV